jgi:hypothetical protein
MVLQQQRPCRKLNWDFVFASLLMALKKREEKVHFIEALPHVTAVL